MRLRHLSIVLLACLISTSSRAELSGDDYLGGGAIQDPTERARVQALIDAERQRDIERASALERERAQEDTKPASRMRSSSTSREGVPQAMFPLKRTSAALILMWSLIPTLAADESARPGSVDPEIETRVQPTRGPEAAGHGLKDPERANDTGQAQDSTNQPGSIESRAEPPPLGLCDGS
jgi:hypothetical protein